MAEEQEYLGQGRSRNKRGIRLEYYTANVENLDPSTSQSGSTRKPQLRLRSRRGRLLPYTQAKKFTSEKTESSSQPASSTALPQPSTSRTLRSQNAIAQSASSTGAIPRTTTSSKLKSQPESSQRRGNREASRVASSPTSSVPHLPSSASEENFVGVITPEMSAHFYEGENAVVPPLPSELPMPPERWIREQPPSSESSSD